MTGWIRTLWKDSLVYGIGYGVSRFLQIIILPIIAHALTLAEFGYYSNYLIFYNFAAGFFILGLDSSVARYFFDSDDSTYHRWLFSSAFFFILGLSLAGIGVFALAKDPVLQLLGIPETFEPSFIYVLLCVPVVALNGFFLNWFKWKREKQHFLINSGGSVVLLLLPLVFARTVTFHFIFQVIFWGQLLVALLSSYFARNYIKPAIHLPMLGTLLRYGFPWMLVYLFGASRTYLDRLFLTQHLDSDTYGIYNFSVRISTLLSLVITAFQMSFGPLAFRIWDKEGAPAFFARLQSAYVFLISSLACCIAIASPLIVHILGGEKFAGAEQVLPILLFAAIPLSLINFSSLGTVYAKKSFLSTLSLFAGFLVVLVLNIFLTGRFLQYGATSASFVGHIAIVITGYYYSRKYYKIDFSYAKDGGVFFFFFALSLFVVNYRVSDSLYINMTLQFLGLAAVMFLMMVFLFPKEMKAIKTGFRGLSVGKTL